ncbi:MAG: translation initiation factor eIF-1A [Candidatus Micrarchaeota archaeon]
MRNNKSSSPSGDVPQFRIRLPKGNEVFGVVIGLVGGSRTIVACKDGKERNCRIPGRLKNDIWVRDGDIVIVQPWDIESDKKGDIIWRYTPLQAKMLTEKGLIRN